MRAVPRSSEPGCEPALTRTGPRERSRSDVAASVVIPSLSGGSALVRLVRSLTLADAELEVIVADNGLAEETRRLVACAGAQLVTMNRNLGFGAAINRAARIARAEILVVLNDDIEPQSGFLDALVAPCADGATMVAGVLVQELAPHLIETAGIELDRTLAAADYLHNVPVARLEQPVPPPFGPSGGAAAYRMAAFRAVGGFDESFFAYCEDVDLAIRLRAAGGTSALAPRARALHAGSGTLGYRSLAKANLVGFSRGYLLRKYRVLNTPRSALAALAVEALAVLLLARRHRSLSPGVARVRGWRSCDTRVARPPRSAITVGLVDAWRRRYVRAQMPASTAGS